jgi:hypothetical protein
MKVAGFHSAPVVARLLLNVSRHVSANAFEPKRPMSTQIKLVLSAICVLFAGTSNATLIDRGGGLIYDDVLNVTWMQNAQYGSIPYVRQVMNWQDAMEFASTVSYEDTVRGQALTGWRLPSTINSQSSLGWDPTGQSSELAYMYYVNLGFEANTSLDRFDPEPTSSNYNPFINLAYRGYWSSTIESAEMDRAWAFHFHFGYQNYTGTTVDEMFWWLVRDGDVAAPTSSVPEPETFTLLAIGLLGIGISRRSKRLKATG